MIYDSEVINNFNVWSVKIALFRGYTNEETNVHTKPIKTQARRKK